MKRLGLGFIVLLLTLIFSGCQPPQVPSSKLVYNEIIKHNYPLLGKIKEILGENQENSVFFIIKILFYKENALFKGKTHNY